MATELEDDIQILTDQIGTGELILRNISQPEAPKEFLKWLANTKVAVETLLQNRLVKHEVNKRLGTDLKNVGGIGSREVEPKLNRVLGQLREIKKFAQGEASKAPSNANLVVSSTSGKVVKVGEVLRTTFDEYVLGKQIGQGGAGTVFEAKSSDGTPVAVKILRVGLPLEKTRRFKNEIGFCQQDNHPGIIKILDHGVLPEGERRLFYVMPFFPKTLRNFLSEEKEPAKILAALTQVLDGLEAAHLRKCIHRDFKPENVLADPKGQRFVLSDFGIAHFEEEDLQTPVETLQQDRLANFQYAAPEQRTRAGKVDHRADLYAFGLVLNEAFTGVIPHGAGYKTIGSVNSDYSHLDAIVEKLIQQSPDSRHQSVEDLKQDLYKKAKLAVSFQKLDAAQKQVVKADDVSSHHLVSDPIRVVDTDYDGRGLVCKLNKTPPEDWINVFMQRGANSFSSMHHPDLLEFHGREITMRTPIDYAAQGKGYVENWVANTNEQYKQLLAQQLQREAVEKRRKLDADAEHEKKRQAFLKQIK